MWAGQGVTMTRVMPAAELVGSLVAEAQSLLSNGHARSGIAPDVRADGRNGAH